MRTRKDGANRDPASRQRPELPGDGLDSDERYFGRFAFPFLFSGRRTDDGGRMGDELESEEFNRVERGKKKIRIKKIKK